MDAPQALPWDLWEYEIAPRLDFAALVQLSRTCTRLAWPRLITELPRDMMERCVGNDARLASLTSLTSLDLRSDAGITLAGVAPLKGVTRLRADTALDPLLFASLTQVTHLTLVFRRPNDPCQLDLAPLAHRLVALDCINWTPIRICEQLPKLTALVHLGLSEGDVYASVLQSLTNLTSLDLGYDDGYVRTAHLRTMPKLVILRNVYGYGKWIKRPGRPSLRIKRSRLGTETPRC